MAVTVKEYAEVIKKITPSKSLRIVKKGSAGAARNRTAQARSQAKKIIQGLHEAEQIRAGKLKATTFEACFGAV